MAYHHSTTPDGGQKAAHPPHPHSPTSESSRDHTPADEKHHENVHTNPIPTTPADESTDPMKVFHNALGIPMLNSKSTNWLSRKKRKNDLENSNSTLSPGNKGIYHEVQSYERWAHIRYLICDSVVTIAMFLQIVVGASVTAFGAGGVSHVLITVFGAANTGLASLLAVLKSQGLPNRLRADWTGWRDLREYIEEKERELHMDVHEKIPESKKKLEVWAEIQKIEAKYRAMKFTIETNRPDTYTKIDEKSLPKANQDKTWTSSHWVKAEKYRMYRLKTGRVQES